MEIEDPREIYCECDGQEVRLYVDSQDPFYAKVKNELLHSLVDVKILAIEVK